MAVHSSGSSNNQTQQSAAPSAGAFNMGGQTSAGPAAVKSWKFGDAAVSGPINPVLPSDQLFSLRDKLGEMIKKNSDKVYETSFLILDNGQEHMYYSSIIVVMREAARPTVVSFYTLILESSNKAPSVIIDNRGGFPVEILRVPGDAYDAKYVAKVQETINKAFPQCTTINAGAMMVSSLLNVQDEGIVHRLLQNASFAIATELTTSSNQFSDLNLSTARADKNLQVEVKFERRTLENAAGEPVRSDVSIVFSSQGQNTSGEIESLNDARREEIFGTANGFIDAVWAPMDNVQNSWGQATVANTSMLPKFAARMVITDISPARLGTLPALLLMYLQPMAVGEGATWFNAFLKRTIGDHLQIGEVNYGDAGALNIQANHGAAAGSSAIGQRVDMEGIDLQPQKFAEYMMQMFRPGLSFSLDVPVIGPQSWYMEVFRAAANGDQGAIAAIVNAADVLTNGGFSRLYATTQEPMFVEADNYVHLGYFEDRGGVRRDIREVDHLFVLNALGEKDISRVVEWHNTFYQTNVDARKRMADRKQIIDAVTGGKTVYTGFAQRVTPSRSFNNALVQAAFDSGLRANLNVPMNALGQSAQMGVASFVGQAAMTSAHHGVFSQRGTPMANGAGFTNRTYGRWA